MQGSQYLLNGINIMTEPRENTPVIVGEIIPRASTPLKIRLSTLEDVRLEMAKVYRDARQNRLDSQDASRLVYMLTQIAKMHETTELVKRLEALEGKQQ